MCGARVCASVCGLHALYQQSHAARRRIWLCVTPRKRLPTLTMPTTALTGQCMGRRPLAVLSLRG